MNVKHLKKELTGVIAALAVSGLILSCGQNESGNNSTTAGNENNTDTSTAVTSTTSPPAKRSGRVSTKMTADDPAVKIEKDKMGYYTRTDVAPAFEGGQSGLEDFISRNIEYPQDAIDNNAEGVVNVQFAVDEKGRISNVTTVGSKIGYGLEEEAIKVVSMMPKWTPGQVKGKNVKTWRTLPINYRLES